VREMAPGLSEEKLAAATGAPLEFAQQPEAGGRS
jgi:acyl CoA:acetate/3-ketoacid CoA transferase beta subunit